MSSPKHKADKRRARDRRRATRRQSRAVTALTNHILQLQDELQQLYRRVRSLEGIARREGKQ